MIFFPSRCYNGGQQHRFEARTTVDKLPVNYFGKYDGPIEGFVMALEASTQIREVYHGDVCIWCGKVVNIPTTKVVEE